MFGSVRDSVLAEGRVALVVSVLALITILLVMVSGMTDGPGQQNTPALQTLDNWGVVFGPTEEAGGMPSYTTSQINQDQLATVVATRNLEFVDIADREVTMLDGTLKS